MNEKTIARNAGAPPFHYLTRRTAEDGKHILLKVGTEPCETDHVFRLRTVWVNGLAHFNGAAAKVWPTEAMNAKHAGLPHARLLERVEKAKEWEPVLKKLKAAEPVSYTVKPHEMGLLRECVKQLDDDVFATIACLTTFSGWRRFMAYAKTADRIVDLHYHWPTLGPIAANPDIALQTYLEIGQQEAKLGVPESARLNAKVAKLTSEKGG